MFSVSLSDINLWTATRQSHA